jgi:glutamine amidotransferase/cyclase
MYFKSGADKVSIGSDAVLAAEEYVAAGRKLSGRQRSRQFQKPTATRQLWLALTQKGCTSGLRIKLRTIQSKQYIKDHWGEFLLVSVYDQRRREGRDFDVRQLVTAVEAMGAGEILLNCIDKDGSNSGFDLELINDVKAAISIPVIASSGAGNPAHFQEVFNVPQRMLRWELVWCVC